MIRLAIVAIGLIAPIAAAADAANRDVSRLNISVAIFDPGIPEDRSVHRDLEVFPRVRKIEALYLPFVLRNVLTSQQEWGAIRVVPDTDTAAELLINGRIVRSDGNLLEVMIRAVDASGRIWVERNFSGAANDQDIYNDIAVALLGARDTLDAKALRNIVEISLLRYAQLLAPAAFDDYLQQVDDSSFAIKRLPASNDPMLVRIERLRGVEYVFTDAVDAKFRELSADVETVYELWREYRRQFNRFQREESLRANTTRSDWPRDSYEALLERYEQYKWDRQAIEEQENWAIGFENEMGPTITAIEERVAELEGWVEDRYAEWQRILAELFELETAVPD
ncbi:MAG: hypothetical protein ACR2QL_08685 [Woeseiaceae bacterium]